MRFRGTTEEGEVVEFKSYCKDSDHVIEYGSEIGIQKNIWKYVKKDSLICVEVEDLERQLAEARDVIKGMELYIGAECHEAWANNWEGRECAFVDMAKFLDKLKEKEG